MSTITEMVTLVEIAVGKRFFDSVAPDKTKLPYATWIQIGGPSETYLEGAETDLDPARLQINVWAKSTIEAKAVMKEISRIMIANPITGEPQGAARGAYSQPANMRGLQRDFVIWFEP